MTDPKQAVRPLLRVRQQREFTDEPVSAEQLDAIADAARWSGSSQNKQPWRFVVLTDPDTLGRIAEAGLPSTSSLTTAPAAIVVTMPDDPERKVTNAYDEGRVAERILIGANLVGLGAAISWLSGDGRRTAGELLGLPEGRMARTVVAIGHPTEAAKPPKTSKGQARLPREETVFRERWGGR